MATFLPHSFSSAPVAATLFGAIAVVSLVALNARPGWIERGVFRPHWVARRGEWATVVTSAFLHADVMHLAFNLFTFWAFAFGLERRIGSGSFAALYALGIAASAAGTWWRHRGEPGYRTLGASGAVLAVLFAAIVHAPGASIFVFPIPVPMPAPVFALLYLGFTVWAARRPGSGINHDAHLAGAAAGLLFVALTDAVALRAAWAHWLG